VWGFPPIATDATPSVCPPGRVSVVAGSPTREGCASGEALHGAAFGAPCHLAADAFGHVFIADSAHHCVRMLSPAAPPASDVSSSTAATGAAGAASNIALSASASSASASASDGAAPLPLCEVSVVVGAHKSGKNNAGSHTEGKVCGCLFLYSCVAYVAPSQ
jgi:hypothetical protein